MVGLTDPDVARERLVNELPRLVTLYGQAAATTAADWYDELRDQEAVKRRFRAIVADLPVDLGTDELARWGLSPVFRADPDWVAAQTLIAGGMTRRVLEPARATVTGSAVQDPSAEGWQRAGSGECAFCRMLIGRGAVYTEATAKFSSHDHCRCSAVPAFKGKPLPIRPSEPSGANITDADRARVREWIKENPAAAGTPAMAAEAVASEVVDLKAADAKAWAGRNLPAKSEFTKAEVDELRRYSGGAYQNVNKFLRTGQVGPANRAPTQDVIQGVDAAMKRSRLPSDVIVHRGISTDALGVKSGADLQALVGKTLQDKGYMSTALGGTKDQFARAQVQMRLRVPKGTGAIYLDPFSQFKGERELLLQRGLRYRITSVKYDSRKGVWRVEAEILPPR